MESKSFLQTLQNKNLRFKHATSLDDVLCLATLVTNCIVSKNGTVDDARLQWLNYYEGDCQECPCFRDCLACIINE